MVAALLSALTLAATQVVAPGAEGVATRRVGVQLDVGAPDGVGATLAFMPAAGLRLQVGGLNNGFGSGLRAGVVLLAFPRSSVRPLLGIDGGLVAGGPGAWALPLVPDPVLRELLRGADVGFVNTQVGLELGSGSVALVLRAGLSWVQLSATDKEVPMNDGTTLRLEGLSLSAYIPSARIGLLICF